ncbi:MAG: GNAT family N-acetyltransferase, partial [Verrucomicrobiae bacterium]|nr:GNAT family N-acetyltransferase [Verrucomicrobiae bacterium]
MSTDPNADSLPIGDPVDGWIPPAPPSRTVLEGHWCRLEPLDPATHAEELFAANQLDRESSIWTYLPYGPFGCHEEYLRWMEDVCAGDDPLFFAIRDLGSGRTTGVASYLRITPPSGSIEVGHLNFSPLLQRT